MSFNVEDEKISAAVAAASRFTGRCGACGTRVVDTPNFGVFVPATGVTRFLYLLCDSCQSARLAGGEAGERVLEAVEMRVAHGAGGRA
jgi:hypothetical protein